MGSGPPAPSPNANGIPRNVLDEYFKSIREPFRETRVAMAKVNLLTEASEMFFILCLFPLIPYVVHEFLITGFVSTVISLYFFRLDLSSFWLLWIGLFLVSLFLMFVAAKVTTPNKKEKAKWLSPKQMRFAYCYGVVDEIRSYRTNHIDGHIETAIEYLRRVRASLMPGVPLGSEEPLYLVAPDRGRMTILLNEGIPPNWYRLHPGTELIMKAFDEFASKLRDRIKDKKDLQAVELLLSALAAYYYTEIPELSSDQPESNFEQIGEESLLSFAQQITGLPPYLSEKEPLTPEERLSQKIRLITHRLSLCFVHENVLITFCAWYLLTLLLLCVGFYIAFRLLPWMEMDTTVVTTMVGGPISAGIAGVAIPRWGKLKKQ